ncbi:16S rRNA (cytosine(967)-C(5))-methyltransferase RsmB, partial [Thermodesulfobacteriota bacterium]
ILRSAAKRLKRGGVLVYSTCTLLREENEEVVERFLEEGDFELEPPPVAFPEACRDLVGEVGIMRTYPEMNGMDGFFAARMRRR